MKPIFDDWHKETFATILARKLGLPLEQVFQPPLGVASWLHNEKGEICPAKMKGLASGDLDKHFVRVRGSE